MTPSTDLPVKRKLRTKSEGLWLMSFADLSFLLMCFFALLLSFSSMDKQRFENVRDGMLAKSPVEIKNQKTVAQKKNNLKTISEKILHEIKKQHLAASVQFSSDGVTVEFNDQYFFRSGSDEVSSQYRHLTEKVLRIIAASPERYQLILEGHTDDVPLGRHAKFKNNWELSSARAVALVKEFKRLGVKEQRLSVRAFAHTRPKIDPRGLTGEALKRARAANRRVVIRIQ